MAVLALALVVLAGVGVAFAKTHAYTGAASARHLKLNGRKHSGLSVAAVKRAGRQVRASRVIVVLRNQHRRLPANRRHVGARLRAVKADQAALTAQVASSGGRVTRRYRALNAFAATVSSAERSRLAANPAVARVIPDSVVRLPRFDDTRGAANGAAAGPTAPNGTPVPGVCPTDPSKPLLEPEALQTTHTAFSDPSTPQAQSLATGKGVKVAFFADGLDIDNPDFIRPDGSHVFIDYQDFSGDGPNAPTGAAEAFGDASSIAAQGRVVYDISQFNNAAHPLPAGCTITVRGMAPDASLIGMKVFGNASSAFDSVILQGLDWAVSHDHADILSESFGEYPIPDTTQDLTRLFNEQAVAAGVTVVESTGDSGVESSVSSATSDPAVIAAGSNTNFRAYAQGEEYGFQFASHGWLSDNVSSIESAGFTQEGRVLDLVAPGEAGWALCSPNIAVYEECTNFGSPPAGSPIQQFGGTSESAPLIAGAVALVDQAYRETHGGRTPSPALIKRLLTSTATDLGFPSREQGAGELNSLAAVQAARSVATPDGAPAATGSSLLFDKPQIDVVGQAGSSTDASLAVTNVGTTTQIVHAHSRALGAQLSDQTGTVTLDGSSPTFVDQFGVARPYAKVTFNVPAGADRLVAFDAWPGPTSRVGLSLIDPHGDFAAYTRPQGDGNHGEVDVHAPTPGTWTAIIFRRDGTFEGPVHWEFTTQRFATVDSVTPSALTLAPGQTGRLQVHLTLPRPGDTSHDLQIDSSSGARTVVPIALRSLVGLGANGGTFSGKLIGGNGRAASPGQLDTYDFDVPAGVPVLGVSVTFPDDAGTNINGTLVDPNGQAVASESTTRLDPAGNAVTTNALQAYRVAPRPGRWRFVVDITNPVGGNALSVPYTGRVTFAAPKATVKGVPNSASTVLKAGKPVTAKVTVSNDGPATEDLFLDPRLVQRQDLSLLALTQATGVTLPLSPENLPPIFLMPTQTNHVAAAAQATAPVTFDWGFGDPHLAAASSGNTASGQFAAPELSAGLWFIAPDLIGPFTAPATPAKVDTGMVVHTRGFDLDASPSTGDVWQQTVDPNAPGFSLVTVAPGKKGTMKVTFTPSGRKGRIVRGTLFVDDFSNFLLFGNELLAIPYEYTVG